MFMDGRNLEELLRTGWHIKYRLTKELFRTRLADVKKKTKIASMLRIRKHT